MIDGAEINLATRFFLDSGLAVEHAQAEQMAEVLYSPDLSADSTLTLLWLGFKKGAGFDVADLTTGEINDACDEVSRMLFALQPCGGEA